MFRAQIAVAFADAALSHSPGDERGVLLLKRLAVGFYGLEGRSGNRAIDEWPGGAEIFSKISGDRLRPAVKRRFSGTNFRLESVKFCSDRNQTLRLNTIRSPRTS